MAGPRPRHRALFAASVREGYSLAMRWPLVAVGAALLGVVLVSCAKHEPDPYFRITARNMEPRIPPGALAAQLTPAERAALDAQGYEIQTDVDDWEAQAALEAERGVPLEGVPEEEQSGFQRTMDHVGKATVAVSSVAIAVGMVVAPFFLF